MAYVLGQQAEGGIIAYILQEGDNGYDAAYQKGIVAASADLEMNYVWGGSGTTINTTSELLLEGLNNTTKIHTALGTGEYAANGCLDYVSGSYSDWALPSLDDAVKIFGSGVLSIGDNTYWTSSEQTSEHAYAIMSLGTGGNYKTEFYSVRPVRYFSIPKEVAHIDSVTGERYVAVGSTSQYTANGVVLAGGTLSWDTADYSIATINQSGLLSALSEGIVGVIATITGGVGGLVSATLGVRILKPASVDGVSGQDTVLVGNEINLTAINVNLAGGTGSWSSSDINIATVSQSGVVRGVSFGIILITYTITGGFGGTKSASKQIQVLPTNSPTDTFKKSYIQVGTDVRKELFETYGIRIKSIPFKPVPDVKDLPKRDWVDQHGDDEYIPSSLKYKAYDMDVKFTYTGGLDSARDAIYPFIQYMQGREFQLYDDFKIAGIRCRYDSYINDAFYRKETDTVEFGVKLKLNNPLCYGVRILFTPFTAIAGCDMNVYWSDGTSNTYVENASVSKSGSSLDFAVVVPSKMSLVTQDSYVYPKVRLDTDNYIMKLTSTGVKYIKQ